MDSFQTVHEAQGIPTSSPSPRIKQNGRSLHLPHQVLEQRARSVDWIKGAYAREKQERTRWVQCTGAIRDLRWERLDDRYCASHCLLEHLEPTLLALAGHRPFGLKERLPVWRVSATDCLPEKLREREGSHPARRLVFDAGGEHFHLSPQIALRGGRVREQREWHALIGADLGDEVGGLEQGRSEERRVG